MNSSSSNDSVLAHRRNVEKRNRLRLVLDKVAKYGIGIGGTSVIFAITLIFFYLAWIVFPLFLSANMEQKHRYAAPGSSEKTLFYNVEEQAGTAFRLTADAKLQFFSTESGEITTTIDLPAPEEAEIVSFAQGDQANGAFVVAYANGYVYAGRVKYDVSYPENKRHIEPVLEHLISSEPSLLLNSEENITHITIQKADENFSIAASLDDNRVFLVSFIAEESLLSDEPSIEKTITEVEEAPSDVVRVLMDKDQAILSLLDSHSRLHRYDIHDKEEPLFIEVVNISSGSAISDIRYLAGSISLLVADNSGLVTQWFGVRDETNKKKLTKIREFNTGSKGAVQIAPEYFRKGFITATESGDIALFHSTAQRTLVTEELSNTVISHVAFGPRADFFLLETGSGEVITWKVENEHPEVSWHALWEKVWYEGYEQPQYIWQSSSASNDFEPKFSLVPISFGTLKAAFYAMLLAMPLAILGAIYAAYFMSSNLRQVVKPSIEIMEALPTVILGFLAGLWLAPFLEEYLPAVFTLVIIIPLGIIVSSLLWTIVPDSIRNNVPVGWKPILLLPVIIFLTWFAITLSPGIEATFFGGHMPTWLKTELGIDFDQRNSMVVGLAMGFAVIPTIFSIAEDAIFSVPKHLTNGSLALGATPWQTLVRVVLPTASPGIFSGVMIGFGRAVGETMIVLMATGNTPVMDLSIFQGMRTLSANIAVEMPESEVASTHYRVLFLAALVLFVFTFLFNTVAEVVRQRLREKYSSI